MDHIKLLSQELLANPNDMMVRIALTDACAEAGVYCPDLLGDQLPALYSFSEGAFTYYQKHSCSGSSSGRKLMSISGESRYGSNSSCRDGVAAVSLTRSESTAYYHSRSRGRPAPLPPPYI